MEIFERPARYASPDLDIIGRHWVRSPRSGTDDARHMFLAVTGVMVNVISILHNGGIAEAVAQE